MFFIHINVKNVNKITVRNSNAHNEIFFFVIFIITFYYYNHIYNIHSNSLYIMIVHLNI
jgi:hypothetical protein